MNFFKLWLGIMVVLLICIAASFVIIKVGNLVAGFISRFFNLPYFGVLAVIVFFIISAALAFVIYE